MSGSLIGWSYLELIEMFPLLFVQGLGKGVPGFCTDMSLIIYKQGPFCCPLRDLGRLL